MNKFVWRLKYHLILYFFVQSEVVLYLQKYHIHIIQMQCVFYASSKKLILHIISCLVGALDIVRQPQFPVIPKWLF